MAITLPLRVAVGNPSDYTDTSNNVWYADPAYSDGVNEWGYISATGIYTYQNPNTITGTAEQTLYKWLRGSYQGNGTLNFKFELPDGKYKITIKTADTTVVRTQRISFNGIAQGTITTKSSEAVDVSYDYTITDGAELVIKFDNSNYLSAPICNGILIEKYSDGKAGIRTGFVCGGNPRVKIGGTI
jgi:hypothetical protein